MNSQFTYQRTEDLARLVVNAYYKTRTGAPRRVMICGALLVVVGLLPFAFNQGGVGLLPACLGALFCLLGIKMHRQAQEIIQDSQRLISDPTVTVSIDRSQITVSSKDSNCALPWSRLTHVRELDGVLLLFTGKLLVAGFPVSVMSAEQKQFIAEQIQSAKSV